MNLEEQRTFIRDKMAELRAIVASSNVDINEAQFERLYDLLTDSMGDVRMKPFTVQFFRQPCATSTCVVPSPPVMGRIGVRWNLPDGYVSVLFGPEEDWEWEAHTVERLIPGETDGSDSSFEISYRHNGACSFKLRDTPYYYLPDEVEELVSDPDVFGGTYEPRLKPHQYNIIWVTNKYDGMLSGYVMVNNRLCYFDMIEETEFKRNRIFAIFELSVWERFNAWRQHHLWNLAMVNKTYWKVYWWWKNFTRKRHKSPEEHWADVDKWRAQHHIVGYFEG